MTGSIIIMRNMLVSTKSFCRIFLAGAVFLPGLLIGRDADKPAAAEAVVAVPRKDAESARRPARRAWSGRTHHFAPGSKQQMDWSAKRTRNWLDSLRRENPEKFEKLMRLRREKPEEFQRQIAQLIRQRGRCHLSPQEQKSLELSRKYMQTKSAEEKNKIMAELRKAVEAAFDARIADRLRRVERMEKELRRIRRQIEERKANRDKICEARIQELTRDPKYRWNW